MPTDSFLLREVFSICHEFTLILKSKWRNLNSRLGGCGICVSEIYFSIFLENKEGKKTEVTLSLILWFNLRLGGYSIWSASTSRSIYDQDFGVWALHSLGATTSTCRTAWRIIRNTQKQPEGCSDYLKYSKTPSKYSTPTGLGYEELGGLSDPGQRDCSKAWNIPG